MAWSVRGWGVVFGLAAFVWGQAHADPFIDTFGSSTTRQRSAFVPQFSAAGGTSYYRFADPAGTSNERTINDGHYAVINPSQIIATGGGSYWSNATTGPIANFRDHTDGNGAVLVVNAGNVQNSVYRRVATLEGGTKYTARAWRFIVAGPTDLAFEIRQPDDSARLSISPNYTTTGTTGVGVWNEVTWTFTTSACARSQYSISLLNNSPVVSGNDLFFDDISVQADNVSASQATVPCSTAAVAAVTAGPDSSSTNVGQPVTVNIVGNDSSSNAGGAPLANPSQGATRPANGTVVFNNGTVTYTPNPGFRGTDTFSYQICTTASQTNPTPVCAEATVTINVGIAAAGITSVPVDAPWALILTALGLAGFAANQMRRRS